MKSNKYAILSVVSFMLIFGIFIVFISVSSRLDEVQKYEIQQINLQDIDNGIYHGESDVSPVFVDIDLTIVDHEISDIHVNYSNIFVNPEELDVLIDMVYINQSIGFDIDNYDVYTAVALFDSIYNALS